MRELVKMTGNGWRIALLAALLVVVGAAPAAATSSGPFERDWVGGTRCEGTWEFDGTHVAVQGVVTDTLEGDQQPSACQFWMVYASGEEEFYVAEIGAFGPHRFTEGTDARTLRVQACSREWIGMLQCEIPVVIWRSV